MNFKAEHIGDFKQVFDGSKHLIRGFEGCMHLELWQDANDAQTFFTYSFWNTESDLEHYRNSELFKSVWSKTKVLFSERPQAWTVNQLF